MKTIYYKIDEIPEKGQVKNLYCDAGWGAYTNDMDKLIRAIENSLCVVSAYYDDKLVGLIRAVGDKESILYIQDILVLKDYKRKGIGTKLINMLIDKYPDVRQKILMTDEREETRKFYESIGFVSCDRGDVVAFQYNK